MGVARFDILCQFKNNSSCACFASIVCLICVKSSILLTFYGISVLIWHAMMRGLYYQWLGDFCDLWLING